VNENTDTFVVQKLRPELNAEFDRFDKGKSTATGWTDLMAQQMVGLAEKGVTPRDISQCLHGIPFVPPSPPVPPQPPMRTNQAQPPEIPAATKRLKESGVDLRILSDSNTFFIDEILRFHGLASDFSLITTNHAHVDEQSILRVSHCHEHACPRCPPNLCKGDYLHWR